MACHQHRAHLQYLRSAHEAGRRPRGSGVSRSGAARPADSGFGDGSQTRSFCYVTDLVDGLYRLMFSGEPYPVNLGNPLEMTILEFAEHIRALTGSGSEIVFQPLPEDDPKKRSPTSRARATCWDGSRVSHWMRACARPSTTFRRPRERCHNPLVPNIRLERRIHTFFRERMSLWKRGIAALLSPPS